MSNGSGVVAAVFVVSSLLGLACGEKKAADKESSVTTGGSAQPAPTAASDKPPAAKPPAAGSAAVDCAALIAAGKKLVGIQLMAQVKTPDSVANMKKERGLRVDTDLTLAALGTLHGLDGRGDAKDAIDFYENATREYAKLLANDAPTQADVDAYNKAIGIDPADLRGSLGRFLGKQAAISTALNQAGCRAR